MCGSTTCCSGMAVSSASIALPPSRSTCTAASVTIGCEVETIARSPTATAFGPCSGAGRWSNGHAGLSLGIRVPLPRRRRALGAREEPLVGHPSDGAVERLDGLGDVLLGVGRGQQAAAVEEIDPLVDHALVQRQRELR